MQEERRKRVCVISFSPIASDARVLRQVQYLSPRYDVTVIGEGAAHPAWEGMRGVRWVPAMYVGVERSLRRLAEKAAGFSMLLAGRLLPSIYDHWYWRQPIMKDTLEMAVASGAELFHANDWNALPVAAEAARRLKARVLFDAHEYAPLEFANRLRWRVTYSGMIREMLRRYAPLSDASVTVAPAIAERYRKELGIDPVVVMNAPSNAGPPPARPAADPDNVRLVYHGAAIPDRGLEAMIKTVAFSDRRFSLHLLLTGSYTAYIKSLRRLAADLPPGRVTFHDPVPTGEVIKTISQYDVGFCFVAPTNYNNVICLPNKFFDFIVAGMPVLMGPSPSMIEIARPYGFGCVAPTFEPEDLAAALNRLDAAQLARMGEAARRAAVEINAEREMGKLLEIYERLLPSGAGAR